MWSYDSLGFYWVMIGCSVTRIMTRTAHNFRELMGYYKELSMGSGGGGGGFFIASTSLYRSFRNVWQINKNGRITEEESCTAVDGSVEVMIVIPDQLRIETDIGSDVFAAVYCVVSGQVRVGPRAVVEPSLVPCRLFHVGTTPVHVGVKTMVSRPKKRENLPCYYLVFI